MSWLGSAWSTVKGIPGVGLIPAAAEGVVDTVKDHGKSVQALDDKLSGRAEIREDAERKGEEIESLRDEIQDGKEADARKDMMADFKESLGPEFENLDLSGLEPHEFASEAVVYQTENVDINEPSAVGEALSHQVESGDTLAKIASEHGMSVDEILEMNEGIEDPDAISVGQEITLGEEEAEAEGGYEAKDRAGFEQALVDSSKDYGEYGEAMIKEAGISEQHSGNEAGEDSGREAEMMA